MQLVFTRRTANTLSVEVVDDEGQPQHQCLLNRFKDRDIRWLAKLWGESVPSVTNKLNDVCETETDEPYDVVEFTPAAGVLEAIVSGTTVETAEELSTAPITIRVRELSQTQTHSASFEDTDVATALRSAFDETWNHCKDTRLEFLIEWNDTSKLCCLDIDYHHTEKPLSPDALSDIVAQVRPLPFCWHRTHGHGAKLYYLSSPGYTAKELASIAGISYLSIDPTASFDLIKSTRHPCYARKRDDAVPPITSPEGITYLYGNSDLSCVKRLLISELEPEAINEWLAERGYVMGSTLLHSECPIDPTQDFKANVYVGDKGFFCHRCYARGLRGGFVSYGELIGSIDNRIALMVKNFCHLEHAKVVLSNIYPHVPIKILEDVYRVMLKITHSLDDPRIVHAMTSGTGYVRIAGMFVSTNGDSALANGLPQFIASLPATKYVKKGGEDAGKLIPDISRTTAFLNDGDLAEYGYPDVTFLRGCRIFGQFNPVDELVKVIVRKEFNNCQPKYVSETVRMPSDEAWKLLDSEFPGINHNYIKLLIATKGASEGRLCQCPFLLVNGPSGAGKSTTVHIAAGICGDKADEPIWNPNAERFRQSLMDGVRNSGFICVNEVFKYADKAKISYTQALDPMLSLTEDSRSHVLYVGSVPFGRLPVFVLTDINIPPEIIADRQLARRFTFFRLDNENFWTDTLVQRRIRPHQFRLISPLHNAAADSILSEVIDRYFLQPTSLQCIAKDLSGPDEYTEDVVRSKTALLDFYKAVKDAPIISGADARRYSPSGGWKLIDRMKETVVSSLWNELCDGQEPEKWIRSRQIDSVDWSTIIGVKVPIMCEYRSYRGNQIYIRFRSSDSAKAPRWLNGV